MNRPDPKIYFKDYDETSNRIKNKKNEFKNSRGKVFSDQFELIGKSYRIHLGNYNELNSLFGKYFSLNFALHLWRYDGEKDIALFIDDLSRLLHNFLSSAATLIDHTRVVNKKIFSNHSFLKEYDKKVQTEITDSTLIQFIKKFRNYFAHIGLVPIRLRCDEKNGEFLVDITIIKEKLLEHDIWNSKSAEFINRMEAEASLRPIIDTYCHQIQSFYLWHQERFSEIFKDEFKVTNKLRDEHNELIVELEKHRLAGIREMNKAKMNKIRNEKAP